MNRHESATPIGVPRLDAEQLWVLAILGFGVGDLVTTSIGLLMPGVVETHPLAAYSFQYTILGSMIVLKGIVFGSCYVLWRRIPRPHCVGVPLGLAAFGVLLTVWNLQVLLRAITL